MPSGEFNGDTIGIVNTMLKQVDTMGESIRKEIQISRSETRDDIKGLHGRIDGLTERISTVETRMNERDTREESRAYGRVNPHQRHRDDPFPALQAKQNILSTVIGHPSLPWLLALVIILVAGIVCFSVLSGRDWRTITPIPGETRRTEGA